MRIYSEKNAAGGEKGTVGSTCMGRRRQGGAAIGWMHWRLAVGETRHSSLTLPRIPAILRPPYCVLRTVPSLGNLTGPHGLPGFFGSSTWGSRICNLYSMWYCTPLCSMSHSARLLIKRNGPLRSFRGSCRITTYSSRLCRAMILVTSGRAEKGMALGNFNSIVVVAAMCVLQACRTSSPKYLEQKIDIGLSYTMMVLGAAPNLSKVLCLFSLRQVSRSSIKCSVLSRGSSPRKTQWLVGLLELGWRPDNKKHSTR